MNLNGTLLLTAHLCFMISPAVAERPTDKEPSDRLVLAHYMPWFEAQPEHESWGWHWTMNAFNPQEVTDGRRAIASHYYPMIDPYDSGDPDVIEYHLLLMKLAGIDGVIVDWYGLQEFGDYPILHRNTLCLVEQVARLKMKFAICYEDQTIPALVEAGRLNDGERVNHAVEEIEWLAMQWFAMDGYVRIDGNPVLLSFGQAGLSDDEWSECLLRLASSIAYFSEHHRRTSAVGAFDWPVPSQGLNGLGQFRQRSSSWTWSIPVAFPRFVDIYSEADVHESWGRIDDEAGATFRNSIEQAMESASPLIQIATWNDWGEGTMIEPSHEFGYRDLEFVQEMRRQHLDSQFSFRASALRLPSRLLKLRRRVPQAEYEEEADRIAELLSSGQVRRASSALNAISPP